MGHVQLSWASTPGPFKEYPSHAKPASLRSLKGSSWRCSASRPDKIIAYLMGCAWVGPARETDPNIKIQGASEKNKKHNVLFVSTPYSTYPLLPYAKGGWVGGWYHCDTLWPRLGHIDCGGLVVATSHVACLPHANACSVGGMG